MKIRKVNIEAFRCFDTQCLDFETNDGNLANLVVLYAPNGFGKTSLFDAIEYGVTGTVNRFTKGVYVKDNFVDKKFRKKHSFLFNKNVDPHKNIRVSVQFDGTFQDIDRTFGLDEENLFSPKRVICNEFFKDVILSQEWFDYFIRSTTPEERCKIFFDYFGRKEDLLSYNKELEDAKKKVKAEISKKKKEIECLRNNLNTAVKGDALLLLQKSMNDYSEEGWKLPTLDGINVDNIKTLLIWKDSLKDDIVKKKSLVDDKLVTIDAVLDESSKRFTVSCFSERKTYLMSLSEKLNKIKDYRQKQDKLLLLVAKQGEYVETINKIKAEKNFFEYYLSNLTKIEDFIKRLSYLKESKKQKNQACDSVRIQLASLYSEQNDLLQQIPLVEKKFHEISTVHDNLKSLYDTYKNNTITKEKYKQRYQSNKLRLSQLQEDNKSLDLDIKIIEEFRKKLNVVLDESLLIYNLYGEKVLELLEQKKKLAEILKKKNEIELKRKGHEQYKSEVQRLVTNSKAIYADLENGVCPLCGYDWKDVNKLIDNIENNQVIDDTIFELEQQYEGLATNANEVREDISNKTEKLQTVIRQDILIKQEQFSDNLKQIASLSEDNRNIEVGLQSLDFNIEAYSGRFSSLDYEQIEANVKEEYIVVQKRLAEYNKRKSELSSRISESEKLLAQSQLDIKNLESEETAMYSDAFYQKTRDCYKNLDGVLDLHLIEYWKERCENLGSSIKKIESEQKLCCLEIEKIHDLNINEFDKQVKEQELEKASEEYNGAFQVLKDMLAYVNSLLGTEFILWDNPELIKEALLSELGKLKEEKIKQKHLLEQLDLIAHLIKNAEEYLGYNKNKAEIDKGEAKIKILQGKFLMMEEEKKRLSEYVNSYIGSFFDKSLINQLYNTIDPHPKYKQIDFDCDFDKQSPRLCVKMGTLSSDNEEIVPNLYFSSAQINILSFCIFMAKALNAQDDKGRYIDCIFIDDPIQAMDDINVLSVVDLLRYVAFTNNKQIIITTHDRNFYELLKKKCPAYLFNSKFFKFQAKGVIDEDS